MKFSFTSHKFKRFVTVIILVLFAGGWVQNDPAHAQDGKCYDPKTQKEISCPSSDEDKNKNCRKNNTCQEEFIPTPTFTETATPSSTPTSTATSKIIDTDTPVPGPISLPRTPSSPGLDITLVSLILGGGIGILLVLIGLWRLFRSPLELPAGGLSAQLGGEYQPSTFELIGEIPADGSVTGQAGMFKGSDLE